MASRPRMTAIPPVPESTIEARSSTVFAPWGATAPISFVTRTFCFEGSKASRSTTGARLSQRVNSSGSNDSSRANRSSCVMGDQGTFIC